MFHFLEKENGVASRHCFFLVLIFFTLIIIFIIYLFSYNKPFYSIFLGKCKAW